MAVPSIVYCCPPLIDVLVVSKCRVFLTTIVTLGSIVVVANMPTSTSSALILDSGGFGCCIMGSEALDWHPAFWYFFFGGCWHCWSWSKTKRRAHPTILTGLRGIDCGTRRPSVFLYVLWTGWNTVLTPDASFVFCGYKIHSLVSLTMMWQLHGGTNSWSMGSARKVPAHQHIACLYMTLATSWWHQRSFTGCLSDLCFL